MNFFFDYSQFSKEIIFSSFWNLISKWKFICFESHFGGVWRRPDDFSSYCFKRLYNDGQNSCLKLCRFVLLFHYYLEKDNWLKRSTCSRTLWICRFMALLLSSQARTPISSYPFFIIEQNQLVATNQFQILSKSFEKKCH